MKTGLKVKTLVYATLVLASSLAAYEAIKVLPSIPVPDKEPPWPSCMGGHLPDVSLADFSSLSVRQLLAKADAEFGDQNYRSSLYYYAAVLKQDAGNELAALGIANNIRDMENRDLDCAKKIYEVLMAGYPDVALLAELGVTEIHLYLGEIPQAKARVQSMMEQITPALRYDPGGQVRVVSSTITKAMASNVFVSSGRTSFAEGDYQRAVQEYQRALQLNESNPYAYIGLGTVALKTGDYEGAVQHISKAVEIQRPGQEPGPYIDKIIEGLTKNQI